MELCGDGWCCRAARGTLELWTLIALLVLACMGLMVLLTLVRISIILILLQLGQMFVFLLAGYTTDYTTGTYNDKIALCSGAHGAVCSG
jgi:hypothetical protein